MQGKTNSDLGGVCTNRRNFRAVAPTAQPVVGKKSGLSLQPLQRFALTNPENGCAASHEPTLSTGTYARTAENSGTAGVRKKLIAERREGGPEFPRQDFVEGARRLPRR